MHFSQTQKDVIILGSAVILGIALYFLYGFLRINQLLTYMRNLSSFNVFLFGLFASFVGNAGILVSLPYAPIIAFLALSLSRPIELVAFGILCGLVAGVGESVCYGLGVALRKKMSNEAKEKFDIVNRKLGRSKGLLVFLAGVSPLPDEFVLVPLASGKYSFRKTVVFNTLGKVILFLLIVFLGSEFFNSIVWSPLTFSLFAPVFIVGYYLFLRIDWKEALFNVVNSK